MEKRLQLAYCQIEEKTAEEVAETLRAHGYETIPVKATMDPSLVTLVFLDEFTTKAQLFAELPWLQAQFEESSEKYLRLMPFVPFHPQEEDIDDLFDEGLGELYEEVFSGEFKPYGWDLDDPRTVDEFERILEENYSE